METRTKTFDAVDESRKWREATSRRLDAMSPAERVAYLQNALERYRAERAARSGKRPMATASS